MDQDFFENQNAITKAILEKDAKTIENVIAQSPWKSKRPLFEYALRLAINLDGGDINAVKMVLGNPRIDKNGEGYKLAITSAFTSAASAPDREVFEFMRETALTAGVDVAQAQKKALTWIFDQIAALDQGSLYAPTYQAAENLVRAGTDVDEASRNAEEKLLAEKAAIDLKLLKIREYKSSLKTR